MDGEGRWVAHPIALRPQRPVGIRATDPEEAHRALPRDVQGGLRREAQPPDDVLPPLLAIPHLIAVCSMGSPRSVVVIIAWFALLFTGRYPQGMYDFVAGSLRYADARLRLRLPAHRPVPAVLGRSARPRYPVDLIIGPPKAEYSRLKVLFRIILMIPVFIIALRDADRVRAGRVPRLVRDRRPGAPTEGPSGHDRRWGSSYQQRALRRTSS